jgi:hopene-associated glycosyltransferase HpnB
MNEMILAVSAVSLAAWVYLVCFHGRFWRSGPVLGPRLRPDQFQDAARVAVVIPARNEAQSIAQCLTSLLLQEYPGELYVVLVDDNSADGTAEIAARLESGGRMTVIGGAPLPAGWTGKMWAVHQGLQDAAAFSPDYVLLTDADIVHAPDHVSRLVAKAGAEGLDLVSEMVRLNCDTAAECAFIPAFVFFFQMLYPFARVNDARKSTAGAAGGTMLVSCRALERIDGVTRIRGELIDDCALAKQIKSSGGRIWLGHSEGAVSLRVYASWRELWDMIARTAYVQLRHSPVLLAGCVAGMGLLYASPPLLAVCGGQEPARWLGAAGWLLMAGAFQPTLRRYGRSRWWGFALPLIAAFYIGATVASAVRHYAGRGGGWKDRVYPAGG